tara:strand:- start:1029 stop:1328 length:300 start_codon:yes stop_codon:yes gene_type:complete
MPNSRCQKCNLYLDDILKTKNDKINFATLIHKRLKKFYGIPYNIEPYIKHSEIVKGHKCCGEMNYEPFAPNPKNFTEFNFSDLFFNFDLDEFIEKINNN